MGTSKTPNVDLFFEGKNEISDVIYGLKTDYRALYTLGMDVLGDKLKNRAINLLKASETMQRAFVAEIKNMEATDEG